MRAVSEELAIPTIGPRPGWPELSTYSCSTENNGFSFRNSSRIFTESVVAVFLVSRAAFKLSILFTGAATSDFFSSVAALVVSATAGVVPTAPTAAIALFASIRFEYISESS